MSKAEELFNQLISEIDDAINNFNESIPAIQLEVYKKLQVLLKTLDMNGEYLKNTVQNIRAISKLKSEIEDIILNPSYIAQVTEFATAFDVVAQLSDEYFTALTSDYTPLKIIEAIKTDAIDQTVTDLTESGITANVTEGIVDLLRTNITTGAHYSDMLDNMRNFILTDSNGLGALEQYTKTITNDSLTTYSRNVNNAIVSDLGLKWFMFSGSMKTTSRPICIAMHEVIYFHTSQIPQIIEGNINGKQTPLGKNGLPLGFKDETNKDNYITLFNGWGCGHLPRFVMDNTVPKDIRERIKQTT